MKTEDILPAEAIKKVEQVIDMYQKAREETGTPFMWFEKEDILRAVKEMMNDLKKVNYDS